MESTKSVLDELASGEDEFDVDLMACGCRLVASPSGRRDAVTIPEFLREHPEVDEVALQQLVEVLIESNDISDKAFLRAVDKTVSRKGRGGRGGAKAD